MEHLDKEWPTPTYIGAFCSFRMEMVSLLVGFVNWVWKWLRKNDPPQTHKKPMVGIVWRERGPTR